MEDLSFIDTNILLRHVRQDHLDHSPRASEFIRRIERGEIRAWTADTVVFETVFTLEKLYRLPRAAIRDNLLPVLEFDGIELPNKQLLPDVFAVYIERNLSFADAFHAVLVLRRAVGPIATFDRGFDRVPGLRRVEP